MEAKTEVEATSILPSLNGKTARSWRGIVPFTHLAREGRMTVTIGRRELLAALGPPGPNRRDKHQLAFLPAALEIVETPPSPIGRLP